MQQFDDMVQGSMQRSD